MRWKHIYFRNFGEKFISKKGRTIFVKFSLIWFQILWKFVSVWFDLGFVFGGVCVSFGYFCAHKILSDLCNVAQVSGFYVIAKFHFREYSRSSVSTRSVTVPLLFLFIFQFLFCFRFSLCLVCFRAQSFQHHLITTQNSRIAI